MLSLPASAECLGGLTQRLWRARREPFQLANPPASFLCFCVLHLASLALEWRGQFAYRDAEQRHANFGFHAPICGVCGRIFLKVTTCHPVEERPSQTLWTHKIEPGHRRDGDHA